MRLLPSIGALNTSNPTAWLNKQCQFAGVRLWPLRAIHARMWAAQWHKIAHAFQMVRQAEITDGVAYSRIIRTRPDLFWLLPHPPLSTLPPHVAVADNRMPQFDWHFVLPRADAPSVLQLYERYMQCNRSAMPPFVGRHFTSEVILHNVMRAELPFSTRKPFGFVLVLSDRNQSTRAMTVLRESAKATFEHCKSATDAAVLGMSCAQVYALAYPEEA